MASIHLGVFRGDSPAAEFIQAIEPWRAGQDLSRLRRLALDITRRLGAAVEVALHPCGDIEMTVRTPEFTR